MASENSAYRRLYESVPVGLFCLDMNGQIHSPNLALLRIFGATEAQDLEGKNLQSFILSEAGDDPVKFAIEDGEDSQGRVFQFVRLDGSRIWVNLRLWKEPPVDQPASYQVCLVELGGVKEVETILAYAQSLFQEANRIKSAFLTKTSHDLRTPLNSILGFSQLMIRDSNLTPDQITDLESINRNGKELLHRINDVLEFAKTESGKAHFREESFRLSEVLSILQEAAVRRAAGSHLEFVLDTAHDLPDLVSGDEEKLRLVLHNLLDNAFQFTQQGLVCLKVRHERIGIGPGKTGSDEFVVVFEVEDTGIGIAEDEMAHIFEPISHGQSRSVASRGIGLGLAISRQYVQLMNGEISVKSRVGKGSCFTIRLPLKREDLPDARVFKMVEGSKGPLSEAAAVIQEGSGDESPIELPDTWKDEMREAALLGDITNILALIDLVRGDHPVFAAKLADLAWHFDYGKIIEQLG